MSSAAERCFAISLSVLVLTAFPALFWGWPAYTDRYGEAVEARYDGPCQTRVSRRAGPITRCDATLVAAGGGTRSGRVTDNLGERLPAAPARVDARARGDQARTRMSGVELWAGLASPPLAAASLLVVLGIGTPLVIEAVRDVRAPDAGAVPRQRR